MKTFHGVILVFLIMSLSGCASSKDTQGSSSSSDSPGVKISGDARIRAGEIYH